MVLECRELGGAMMGHHGARARRIGKLASAAVLVALVGCASPTVTDGRGAPTYNLVSLEIGVSDEGAVRAALGEPRGNGFVRHSAEQPARRSIWYYELVQVKDDQVGLKILLVFFSEGKYDGYVWFAAQELRRLGEP
jgi:hypothetical protein